MGSILFALASLLILTPIIYFFPMKMTLKGKLIITGVSLLIAVMGLLAYSLVPLWQLISMLLLLIILSAYLLFKRMGNMLFANDDTWDEGHFTSFNKPSMKGQLKPHSESTSVNELEQDKDYIPVQEMDQQENVAVSDHKEVMVDIQHEIEEIQIIKDVNEEETKRNDITNEIEEIQPQQVPVNDVDQDDPFEEEQELEQLLNRDEVQEINEVSKIELHPAQETTSLTEVESHSSIDEDHYLSEIEKLLEADEDEMESSLQVLSEPTLDIQTTSDHSTESEQVEDTYFSENALHWDDLDEMNVFPQTSNDSLEKPEDCNDEIEELQPIQLSTMALEENDQAGLQEEQELPILELNTNHDELTVQENEQQQDSALDAFDHLISNGYTEVAVGNEIEALDESVIQLANQFNEIVIEDQHDQGEQPLANEESLMPKSDKEIEELSDLLDEMNDQEYTVHKIDNDQWGDFQSEERKESLDIVADEEEFLQPKTSIQKQLFHTMIAQIQLSRKQMNPIQYEQFIKDHLHPGLLPQDYFTFATLLIEHYIDRGQFDHLTKLVGDLQEKYFEYPIISMELDYLSEQYCKKAL